MLTKTSGDFISHRLWFQSVLDENVILCGVSALECLGMFTGYVNETIIDVYALSRGRYENINYIIVSSFDDIDYVRFDNVLCTTFEQTINDMLSDLENTDEMALTEALSNFYYSHNESFNSLHIKSENRFVFNNIQNYAINYYSGG